MAYSISLSGWHQNPSDPIYRGDNPNNLGLVVNSDAEFEAAVAGGVETNILLAPGIYSSTAVLQGVSRAGSPLTVQSQFPNNRGIVQDVGWSLRNSDNINIYNIDYVATDPNADPYRAIEDSNGQGCNDIEIAGCGFYGVPRDLNAAYDPYYANGLISGPRLNAYDSYNIRFLNNNARYVSMWLDARPNGNLLVKGNFCQYWYFDGLRITAQGDEGLVPGNRFIEENIGIDCIGIYDEQEGQDPPIPSAPHPDNTQGLTAGGGNNTNARMENTMFRRNIFHPGFLRANQVQNGLTQIRCNNVAWIKNLALGINTVHGVSYESGVDGTLLQQNTFGASRKNSSPFNRFFKSTGQALVVDNYIPAGFNLGTGGNANLAGFELDDINNVTGFMTDYDDHFNSARNLEGASGALEMFTPLAYSGVGAVNAQSQLVDGVDRPTRADAPDVTGGSSGFSLDLIRTPTFYHASQASNGGLNYTRFDVRWAPDNGAFTWTSINDVQSGDFVSGVTAGDALVQTRCVNSAGEGLWSQNQTVSIS